LVRSIFVKNKMRNVYEVLKHLYDDTALVIERINEIGYLSTKIGYYLWFVKIQKFAFFWSFLQKHFSG